MHPEAYEYVRRVARSLPPLRRVLELGSRDVNGSVRNLFAGAEYVGLDLAAGPGVDMVTDAADWPGEGTSFDCIVSTEMLEHTPRAADVCANAYRLLVPGGVLILTAASEGRTPHGVEGGEVGEEYYANISAADLRRWLAPFAFALVDDGENPGDLYATAFKGPP